MARQKKKLLNKGLPYNRVGHSVWEFSFPAKVTTTILGNQRHSLAVMVDIFPELGQSDASSIDTDFATSNEGTRFLV